MKHRKWTSKQKSQIVLEGLSGQIDISQLCQKYQVSQTQYYKWRDLFLQNCHQSFEVKKQTEKEQYLESEVKKLKNIIGDLTIDLRQRLPADISEIYDELLAVRYKADIYHLV